MALSGARHPLPFAACCRPLELGFDVLFGPTWANYSTVYVSTEGEWVACCLGWSTVVHLEAKAWGARSHSCGVHTPPCCSLFANTVWAVGAWHRWLRTHTMSHFAGACRYPVVWGACVRLGRARRRGRTSHRRVSTSMAGVACGPGMRKGVRAGAQEDVGLVGQGHTAGQGQGHGG